MKDRTGGCCSKYFESSIFIPEYYSPIHKTNRKTKSTFYAVLRQKPSEKY